MAPDPKPRRDRPLMALVSDYAGLAFTLPAAVFVGFGIGYLIDHHWHTGRTFEVIFLFLGFGAGFLELIRAANRK